MIKKYVKGESYMLNIAESKNRSPYKKSEKFYKHLNKVKELHTVKGENESYWNEFESNSNKTKTSLCQYKSAVKRYLDTIQKDILLTNTVELETYLNDNFKDNKTKENQKRYINSFITYTICNNIDRASKITNEKLILSLIPDEYKLLIKVLIYRN
jgi:hypothetical protein